MEGQFSRSRLLIGEDGIKKLQNAKVAVFGVGGVGGYTAEALARAGIGTIGLIDKDIITLSNLNRQIIALHSTLGKSKVQAMAERIKDINPNANVHSHMLFYSPETSSSIKLSDYDYLIDAIDTVSSKIELILNAKKENVPIISCMGAGNKLDPTAFKVADIYSTSVCPLAKVMRRELKRHGIQKLKVLYSQEQPIISNMPKHPNSVNALEASKKQPPSSISFVPSVAGLIIAGEVARDILNMDLSSNR